MLPIEKKILNSFESVIRVLDIACNAMANLSPILPPDVLDGTSRLVKDIKEITEVCREIVIPEIKNRTDIARVIELFTHLGLPFKTIRPMNLYLKGLVFSFDEHGKFIKAE